MAAHRAHSLGNCRGTAILVLVGCLHVVGTSGAQDLVTGTRVRTSNSRLAGALRHGVSRSPTLGRLVETLTASDLLVYLADGTCDSGTESCLMLGSSGTAGRIVRINFQLSNARRNMYVERYDHLVAQIAHELQHALEIAADSSIVNAGSLRAAYGRIGLERATPRGVTYETVAALQIGRDVLSELRRHGRRAHPVPGRPPSAPRP
jgi:hypothetical protein